MLVIQIIVAVISVIGAGYYIGFVIAEGKDERGQTILGKSSQIVFPIILLGFVFLASYISLANPNVEQVEAVIYIWMGLIWGINSLSILSLKKNA